MDDAFNPKDVAKTSAAKLGPKLGKHSFDQLAAMEEAERGSAKPRKDMLQLLQAEISARRELSPGVDLTAVSKARIAESYLRFTGPEVFAELDDESKAAVFSQVAHVFDTPTAAPADEADAMFRRFIGELAPLFLEIERLEGQRVREVIAEGDMAATGARKAETLVKEIAQLAFCDGAGEALFKIEPSEGDITLRGNKAVYGRAVELVRDKPRVDVSQVVALSDEGRRLARVKWPVPLTGGGGRLALIPAGYIAFSL